MPRNKYMKNHVRLLMAGMLSAIVFSACDELTPGIEPEVPGTETPETPENPENPETPGTEFSYQLTDAEGNAVEGMKVLT
jgi:hypothetical protein